METTVYIQPEFDIKFVLKNCWLRFNIVKICKHLGLGLFLMLYTVGGGLIFRELEAPVENAKLLKLKTIVQKERNTLIDELIKHKNLSNYDQFARKNIRDYEKVIQETFLNGLHNISGIDDKQTIEMMEKWTFLKAVFFSSTVLTTIGYGDVAPVTTEGRAFCMVFALVGIPLTLTVIADWGRLFASILSRVLPTFCRRAMEARRLSLFVLSAVCFLFVYITVGAFLFKTFEDEWDFFDGFYFCFITMTTIGFGDLVPITEKPEYLLYWALYILFGLALTSTIIELVRRQYAQSWRQLQALSGPLATNLRKLAENAPGLDVTSFQQDLLRVLAVVSMPKKSISSSANKVDQKKREDEWEEAMEALIKHISTDSKQKKVQIVIYESSV